MFSTDGRPVLPGSIFRLLLLTLWVSACTKAPPPAAQPVAHDKETKVAAESQMAKPLPRLRVAEGNQFDVGTVLEGTEPHVFFTLANDGAADARIVIDDLSQGGCTAVSIIPTIAPGSSSKLDFVFETTGYGGRTDTRKLRINYNNPALSPLEISATAKILPLEKYQAAIGEVWFNYYLLVDLRSPADFAREHVAGSINVPVPELNAWASHVPKHLLIYLLSQDGRVSDQEAAALRKSGFSRCVSVVGGIDEWKKREGKNELLIPGPG